MRKWEYEKYVYKTESTVKKTWNKNCLPDYRIAGAECLTDKDCKFFDYENSGGSCLKGVSDVFLHCEKRLEPGNFSDWKMAEDGVCRSTDFFRQDYRICTKRFKSRNLINNLSQIINLQKN